MKRADAHHLPADATRVAPGLTGPDAIEAWRQPAGVRTRVVSWDDPREGVAHALRYSGLELLRAIIAGEVPPPPIGLVLGFAITAAREGEAEFEVIPGEHHYNPIGTVHGGIIATLLDSAMGCAVHTTLPAGVGYTTADLQVRYVRPIFADTGRLRCVARVVHRGRRVATASGELRDEAGKLYAHATTGCMLFEARSR